MKTSLIIGFVAVLIAASAAPVQAQRQAVSLPYTFGANPGDTVGQSNGVDTSGAGTLTINSNISINASNNLGGGITSTAANTATVVFLGNSTVTGFTGTALSQLLNIKAGVNGTTVNFNGTVNVGTFNVTGNGTITFNGNVSPGAGSFDADGFINLGPGVTLTGAITTLTARTGTLTLSNGSSVTGAVGGANGLKQINLVGASATLGGAVQTAGFNLGGNTLTIMGALATNPGGTISTTIASNTAFGHVIVNGSSNINASGITVIPTVTGQLTTGTNFRIVDARSAGTAGAIVTVQNNSPLYTFVGVPTSTGDVNIILQSQTPVTAIVSSPAAAAAGQILGISSAPGSDLRAVQDAISSLTSAPAIDSALSQLAPGATNLAAPWVAAQLTRQFEDLWMARAEEIQNVCCDRCNPTTPNADKCRTDVHRSSLWAKGFGRDGRQDDVDNVDGYKTRGYGVMAAFDTPLNEQTRAGVGFGYARNTLNDNSAIGRTEIDSYQLTAYIGYAPGPWFVQGIANAEADRYDGSRRIMFTGIDRTAASDYSGQQYGGVVTAGIHFTPYKRLTVTPLASFRYSRVNVDGYTETGAGDVSLRVNSQDYEFAQSGLGVKAERQGKFTPEVHFKWLHDFNSTTMQEDAAFTGGGNVFTTRGINQSSQTYNVGAGLNFLSCACGNAAWTVKGLYDYKWTQSDYSDHQVSMVLSARF